MKTNLSQRKVKIISEIHPQFLGSFSELKRMVLQCKLNGADYIKVQLYDSKKLFDNEDRVYLEISEKELIEINKICNNEGIKLTASIFDEERLEWCEKLDFDFYKIASITVKNDLELCKKIISTKKKILVSLGMYNYDLGKPFEDSNVEYLYCVSKYPTNLFDVSMPHFGERNLFQGFSDHTIGLAASIYAISRGAMYIEKHFSNNKSLNVPTQLAHVCSMDAQDLLELRKYADAITLLKVNSFSK